MITARLTPLVHWMADYYLLSTVLLLIGLVVIYRLKQPSRRMAVARSIVVGLAALAVLATAPNWPRINAVNWPATEASSVAFVATSPVLIETHPEAPAQPAPMGIAIHWPVEARTVLPLPPTHLAKQMRSVATGNGRSWRLILGAAFMIGAALNLAWLALGAIQVIRLRRTAYAITPRLETLLARVSPERDPAPQVCLSRQIELPVAIGVLRPTIVLPDDFAASEPEERLEAALAHEWAHIRNGDLRWLAVLRLLNVLLFAQPLFWWLRREVRADQEALADAAASAIHGDDRIAYAETLVRWARSTTRRRPSAMASAALALWERPSTLHRRVRLLLDPHSRVEQHTSRRWKLGAAALGLSGTLLLSTLTLRPPAATAQVMKAEAKADSPADSAAPDSINATGPFEFAGQVLGPDGKRFAGAKLHLAYYRYGRDPDIRIRAISDSSGHFRFFVARDDFEPSREEWNNAQVVASADGYGPGWENTFKERPDSPQPDPRNLTIRLARDDIAIAGRLVDLQGRPVRGASIEPGRILESKNGDLSTWMAAATSPGGSVYESEQAYLSRSLATGGHKASVPIVTDADGRFTITGVGRERIIELKYYGPMVQTRKISVMTRNARPFMVTAARRSSDWGITQFYGDQFTHAAAPTKPVIGVVKDRDTGKPLAGVKIACNKTADFPVYGFNGIEATTDRDGRYSLVGLPKGIGNVLVVIPAKDNPYLASAIDLPDTPGLGPITLDVGLKQGVLIEGRVTDKETGKPVQAFVEYNTYRDNPHLAQAPGFDSSATWEKCITKPDGSYRVVGLPGRGLVSAISIGSADDYLTGVGLKEDQSNLIATVVPHNTTWNFNTFAEIDIPKDVTTTHTDLALERGLVQTVRIVDPDGRPVTRARVQGQFHLSNWSSPLVKNQFQIHGLRRGEKRRLHARLEDRGLAGSLDIVAGDQESVTLKLQPWATVVGRLVDDDGMPRDHVDLVPNGIDPSRHGDFVTDSSGRFRIAGVIPGLPHDIWVSPRTAYLSGKLAKKLVLAPGEVKDLGDVKEEVQ
jgi:beta-lactamase regulating signal transducer with metallopeptidase domain/protocatechuate 3,4-dioxygenase beta subunit